MTDGPIECARPPVCRERAGEERFSVESAMRFFLLGNGSRPGVREAAEQLLPVLKERGEVVVCDLEQRVDLSRWEADLAVVLGGDGAILRAVRQMGYHQVPVVGVNLGKLGFLADLNPESVCRQLPNLLSGDYQVGRHLMYECEVGKGASRQQFIGLNEIVIHAGPPFRMIDLDLSVDGEWVATYRCDGLIISTPVGSTGHNLSAGGPILRQDLQAFVITPICAHTLTHRPLIDRSDRSYEVRLGWESAGATLMIDGQEAVAMSPGDRAAVRQAPVQFQLVKVPGQSYYQTLRGKLNWGSRPQYRGEP